MLIRAITM